MRSFKNYLEAKAPSLTFAKATKPSANLNLPNLTNVDGDYVNAGYNDDDYGGSYSSIAYKFGNQRLKAAGGNPYENGLLEKCKQLAENILSAIRLGETTYSYAKITPDNKFITNILQKDLLGGMAPNFSSADIQYAVKLNVFIKDSISGEYSINIEILRSLMEKALANLQNMKSGRLNNQNKGIYKIGQTMDNISGRLKGQGSVPNYGNAR